MIEGPGVKLVRKLAAAEATLRFQTSHIRIISFAYNVAHYCFTLFTPMTWKLLHGNATKHIPQSHCEYRTDTDTVYHTKTNPYEVYT